MNIGLSTYSFPWFCANSQLSPEEKAVTLIGFSADAGIRFLQFGDNLPLHEFSGESLDRLVAEANRREVNVQVGMRGLRIEHAEKYIGLAARLKSPFLRIVTDDENLAPREDEIVDDIGRLLPLLRKSRVILAIENHDRLRASALAEIVRRSDPEWVGICLDTANSLGAGEGISEVVDSLAGYTVNLHLKDFVIRRVDHKMGFRISGVAAGAGMLDIPWLIRRLNGVRRCETATLELWMEEGPSNEETLLLERRMVLESLEYLKTIIT